MTLCQWHSCRKAGVIGVVLDLAQPTKVLCDTHARMVAKKLNVSPILQQRWWPTRGVKHRSRRAVTGRDWMPPAEMRSS